VVSQAKGPARRGKAPSSPKKPRSARSTSYLALWLACSLLSIVAGLRVWSDRCFGLRFAQFLLRIGQLQFCLFAFDLWKRFLFAGLKFGAFHRQ